MKVVAFTCPGCGAQLSVDQDKKLATCQYCGANFPVDDEAQHVRYDNAEQAGYEFEKGRLRAQAEYAQSQTFAPLTNQQVEPKKKRKTWLWVLGWLFMFPLPLTILMVRNKKLDKRVRIAIVAAAWLLYVCIGLYGENDVGRTTVDYGLTSEQIELVTNPSEEYVFDRLSKAPHVLRPTKATPGHDPNRGLGKEEGYTADIFFESDLVDQSKVDGDNVLDKGTSAGGSVEVFSTVVGAVRRDEQLASRDGRHNTTGYHAVVGTCVIRTSKYLDADQQKVLESSIVESLTRTE